jgi:broad specificity phosphatase PhoE
MQMMLLRHAERENTGVSNPSLSPHGQRQAQALCQKIQNGELPRPTHLWTSPKNRARQTLQKISSALSLELQVIDSLDERQSSENFAQFQTRIRRFFQSVERQAKENPGGVLYCCTHLDWLEEALPLVPTLEDFSRDGMAWAPAQYLGFEIRDEFWTVAQTGRIEA